MRVHTTAFIGLLVLVAGVGACAGPGSDPEPIPTDQLMTRRAEVYCAKTFECCSPAEQASAMATFDWACNSEECCATALENFYFYAFLDRYQASVDRGRVSFSNDFVAGCLAETTAQSCADWGPNGNACTNMFTPLQITGEVCADDYECELGYCAGSDWLEEIEGTCAPKPGLGEPCPDEVCATGFYCDLEPTVHACATLKADGEICATSSECAGGACSDAFLCMISAYCDGTS